MFLTRLIINCRTKYWVTKFLSTSRENPRDIKFYDKYFKVLELEPGSSKDIVRRQYIKLVKKYHPDGVTGDEEKRQCLTEFQKVDEAYKELQKKFLEDKKRDEQSSGEYGLFHDDQQINDEEDKQSKYRSPQHRQYLSNEGYGFGSPAQREKQYQKIRAARAIDNVHDHRVSKLGASYEDRLVEAQRKAVKKQRSQNAIERLVEDLIIESMANGEFENLKGSGKPLPERVIYNPYEDFTTHKLNQILAEGGFAPEWIMLKKEIENEKAKIRDLMKAQAANVIKNKIPRREEIKIWTAFLNKLQMEDVKNLNHSINRFNLLVPLLNSQMVQFSIERESEIILKKYLSNLTNQINDSIEKIDVKVKENADVTNNGFLKSIMKKFFG